MHAPQGALKLAFCLVCLSGTIISLTSNASPSTSVYISNFGNNTVVRIDPEGSVTTLTNPNLNGPTGVAVDAAGNVYVANQNNNTVVKFDPSGNGTVFAQTNLSQPTGLALDAQSNLYVANPGNSTIMKFDPKGNGSLFASFGLNGPEGIAFDTHSNLYVANYWGNNIAKVDPAGNASLFSTISHPEGLAFDSAGFLYSSTASNNAVIKFDGNGTPSAYFGTNSSTSANGLVFDNSNNLYVVYYWANVVTEVGTNGLSSQAVGPLVLNKPIFIALAYPATFPPVILLEPQGEVAYWGATASFSVGVSNPSLQSYLWYKDGVPISWATNSSITLTNLALTDAGDYSVVVTNAYGSVTSSNALLVVNPAGVSIGLYPGLTIQGVVGKTFGIQYATNVSASAVWTTITNLTLSQPVELWFDASANTASGTEPKRYYRVVAVP